MRIFDQIASGRSVLEWEASRPSSEVDARWRKMAHEAKRVIADEAEDYIRNGRKAVDADCSVDRFGSVLPPYPITWIEWKVPTQDSPKHRAEWGIPDDWCHVPKDLRAMVVSSRRDDDGDFLIHASLLTSSSTNNRGYVTVMPLHARVTAGVTPDTGQVVTVQDLDFGNHTGGGGNFGAHLHPGWLALAWMNCRSFELDRVPAPPGRSVRSRKSSRRVKGNDYYRIVLGKSHRSYWESKTGVDSRRWHMVPGRLADYTRTGLFNDPARKGFYWKPAHTRGDKSLGTINHEYHVTAEAAQ